MIYDFKYMNVIFNLLCILQHSQYLLGNVEHPIISCGLPLNLVIFFEVLYRKWLKFLMINSNNTLKLSMQYNGIQSRWLEAILNGKLYKFLRLIWINIIFFMIL